MHILLKGASNGYTVNVLWPYILLSRGITLETFLLYILTSSNILQRGEAKLLVEDWEGAVADVKSAAEKSPQVCYLTPFFYFTCTYTIYGLIFSTVRK